jgi:GNAT superfamily N-acetyltransferase
MPKIVIRRVCAEDATMVRDLRLRALATDPQAFASSYAKEAAFPDVRWRELAAEQATSSDRATFLAVTTEDTVVGLIVAIRDAERLTVFGVFAMWVAPEVRRKGVAAQLLVQTEAWIASVGGTRAELFVTDAAPNARRMYERAGWVADDRLEYGGAGQVERGMTKTLR